MHGHAYVFLCYFVGNNFGQPCMIFFIYTSMQSMADKMNRNNMLRLQETSTDMYGSLIVYAAVEMSLMNMVLNGGDSSCVALLPSGFAIVPDCFPKSEGPSSCNETIDLT